MSKKKFTPSLINIFIINILLNKSVFSQISNISLRKRPNLMTERFSRQFPNFRSLSNSITFTFFGLPNSKSDFSCLFRVFFSNLFWELVFSLFWHFLLISCIFLKFHKLSYVLCFSVSLV